MGLLAVLLVVAAARGTITLDVSAGPDHPAYADQPVTASSLPRRVVVGYWQGWGSPSVRLREVPAEYDLVLASFAVSDTSGTVRFSQSVQSHESFVGDVDSLQTTGRRVLLSVGGWDDGGLQIRTEAQVEAFLRSITPIIDSHHFSGVDWDLEHGIDPARVAEATHRLKARYGADFLITMAPMLGGQVERQQFDLGARIKGVLDMVSPQFYNGGSSDPSWVVTHTQDWARVVGQDKVGMGFMTVSTPTDTGERSPDEVCAIWRDLVTRAPRARGLMTWSVNLDRTSGYDFARTCAPVVHRSH